MRLWNWDQITHRAEFPEAEALFLGLPAVFWVPDEPVTLVRSPAGGWDSEDRAREVGYDS